MDLGAISPVLFGKSADIFSFPISGVFIGANLALASLNHLGGVIESFDGWLRTSLITAIILTGASSLLASNLMFRCEHLAHFSIILLLLTYVVVMVCSVLSVYRKKEEKEALSILSSHHQNQRKNDLDAESPN